MRMRKLTVEIFDDAVGKPYVKIEGWPDNEESGVAQAPGLDFKVWSDEIVVEDYRKAKP